MRYQEFLEKTVHRLNEMSDGKTVVEVCIQQQNNGVQDARFVFRNPDEPLSPAIGAAPCYDACQRGMGMEEMCRNIWKVYLEKKPGGNAEDMSFLYDAKQVLQNVVCRVINHDYNEELLQDVPHRRYLNLAVVYYCVLDRSRLVEWSVMISGELLKHLGISVRELDRFARENTRRRSPVQFGTIRSAMEDLLTMGDCVRESRNGAISTEPTIHTEVDQMIAEDEVPLYVLTNRERMYGAYWMTDPEVQERMAARIGEDYYILPSSLHECMVVPVSLGWPAQGLIDMVRDVNRECLAREEVLADTIYYYSAKEKKLSLISGR